MATLKKDKEKRESNGSKKIQKIDNKNSLQVTFSKRRSGLFKKASELSILCGAEIAIIVLSPKGKVFTFGHPSADAIIHRYLTGCSLPEKAAGDSLSGSRMQEYNAHYSKTHKLVEEERKRGEKFKEESKAAVGDNGRFWWDEDADAMGLTELEQFIAALEELKRRVEIRANEVAVPKASSLVAVDPAIHGQSGLENHAKDETEVIDAAIVPHGSNYGRGDF